MAQVKNAAKISDAEAQQLSDQIDALKGDIASISQLLVEMGKTRRDAVVDGASDKVTELRDRSEKHLQDAQVRVEDMANQAVDAVRNQPATAMGIAVGLGFLLGFMSGRK